MHRAPRTALASLLFLLLASPAARAQFALPSSSSAWTPPLDFGGVAAGRAVTSQFTISVTAPVTGLSITVAPSSSPFSLASSVPSSAGGPFPVVVQFAPPASATSGTSYNAQLRVVYSTSSGPGLSTIRILTGLVAQPGQDGQGTHLTRSVYGGFDELHADLSRPRNAKVQIAQGHLVLASGGPVPAGTELEGPALPGLSGPTTLRVELVEPHRNPYNPADPSVSDRDQYLVTVDGELLCPDTHSHLALALPGYWKEGRYYDTRSDASFACIPDLHPTGHGFDFAHGGGVVAKCIDWGFKPWGGATGPDDHAACVRMALADYCGRGVSSTVDGTLIDGYQRLPPDAVVGTTATGLHFRPSKEVPLLDFEGAWTSRLDSTTSPPSHVGRVLCLAKRRWSTLPVNFSDPRCAGLDPRPLPIAGKQQPGRYCEDLARDGRTLAGGDIRLFNYSPYIDAGLYLCGARSEDATGLWSHVATTTSIDLDQSPMVGGLRFYKTLPGAAPGPEVVCPLFLGTVFHPDVMKWDYVIPEQFPRSELVALCRHPGTGAPRVAPITRGVQSCGSDTLEGYIFGAHSPRAHAATPPLAGEALHLFEGPAKRTFLATEKAAAALVKLGAVHPSCRIGPLLGYLIRLR